MVGKKKKNGKKYLTVYLWTEKFEEMIANSTPSDREWGKTSTVDIYKAANQVKYQVTLSGLSSVREDRKEEDFQESQETGSRRQLTGSWL
jgi:hypothetical protein